MISVPSAPWLSWKSWGPDPQSQHNLNSAAMLSMLHEKQSQVKSDDALDARPNSV